MTDRPTSLLAHPNAPVAHAETDPFADVLRTVRIKGAVFFLNDLSAPATAACVPDGQTLARAIASATQNVISYHVVTRGTVWAGLFAGGAAAVRLDAGDVLVIPRGDPYWVGTQETKPPGPDERVVEFMRLVATGALPYVVPVGGGGEPRAGLVCGFLGCDQAPFNPLVAALPPFLVVRGARRQDGAPSDRLDRLIEVTLAEAQENQPGGAAVRLRLSELIFVETIRRYVGTVLEGQTGWLAALRDDVVGRAIGLLHERPAETWTLPSLAKQSGTSRSALARRFTELVGQPPMAYLTQWRMQLAAQKLADGATKVSAVALEVGYDSEAAFSRAFKRAAGVAPAAWRDRGKTAA